MAKSGDGIILIVIAAAAYFLLGGRGAAGYSGGGGGGGSGSLDGGDGFDWMAYRAEFPYVPQTEYVSAIARGELETGNYTTTDYGQTFTLGGGIHL
jgi:hypothetical protein